VNINPATPTLRIPKTLPPQDHEPLNSPTKRLSTYQARERDYGDKNNQRLRRRGRRCRKFLVPRRSFIDCERLLDRRLADCLCCGGEKALIVT
jgi:hypothetical protein